MNRTIDNCVEKNSDEGVMEGEEGIKEGIKEGEVGMKE